MIGRTGPKTVRGTATNISTASSLAKEAGSTLTADSSRAGSDERSRKDKCGDGAPSAEGRVGSTQLICHGCKQEGKLKIVMLAGDSDI